MQITSDLAVEFLEKFPYPIFLFARDYRLLGTNPAGLRAIGREEDDFADHPTWCYEIIYGRSEPCPACQRDLRKAPFCVSELSPNGLSQNLIDAGGASCILMTGDTDGDGTFLSHYKLLLPAPRVLTHLRSLHEFAREIEVEQEGRAALSTNELVRRLLGYMVSELGFESARYWEVEGRDGYRKLVCRQQENSTEQFNWLVDDEIPDDPKYDISWWAVNNARVTYISNDQRVVKQLFKCTPKELKCPEKPFPGTDMDFQYYDQELLHKIRKDNAPHSWLDIPLVNHGRVFGKISISHPNVAPISQEECEVAFLFAVILNQHLARLDAREQLHLNAIASISHELRQPTELAAHSVDYLKGQLIGDRNRSYDKMFTLQNLQQALKLIRNLNEVQNLPLSEDSHSGQMVNLVKEVIHPIVNMIRQWTFMRYVHKTGVPLSVELVRDLVDEKRVRVEERRFNIYEWTVNVGHVVYFEDTLRFLGFYLREARLQEIFYNLLMNALKYRHEGAGMRIHLQRAHEHEAIRYLPKDRSFDDYEIIQFVDYGLGIEEHEAGRIFEPGFTGSAAQAVGSDGNGIGLYLARAIARGFGGDLLLTNHRGPTRFDLLIPKKTCRQEWWTNV